MNPKQKGVKAGYHYGSPKLAPSGSDPLPEHEQWLEGWTLGIDLRNRHREELLALIVKEGGEQDDGI